MPIRIAKVQVRGAAIGVDVEVEGELTSIGLHLQRYDAKTSRLTDNRPLDLRPAGASGTARVLHADADLETLGTERIKLKVSVGGLSEVDAIDGPAENFRDLGEVNPLATSLLRFWPSEKLSEWLERPHAISKSSQGRSPQSAFQNAVAAVLNMAGFCAIDLGHEDILQDPMTKVERATADILAYREDARMLVVGECTIGPLRDQDVAKVINAAAVLSESIPHGARVTVVPVLFTSIPVGQTVWGGVPVIDRQGLAALRQEVERGSGTSLLEILRGALSRQGGVPG